MHGLKRALGPGVGVLMAGFMALTATPGSAQEPIVIGAAIALSGFIAPYDEGPAQAMAMAIEEVNAKGGLLGRPLTVVQSDTKSDIAYGATAAQDVIDQGAVMVVVTCDYDFGGAAASVANAQNLITFSTCAGDPKFGPQGIGPNAFTLATSASGQAAAMAEWGYREQGWRSAYILLDTTIAFDATWADTFKRRWIELGGAEGIVGEDTFGGEDPQIASQITRIKALPQAPDVIVMASFPPAGVSAMRQIRAAGIATPLVGSESWDGDYWLEGVPDLSDMYFVTYASVFGTDPRDAQKAFMDKFVAKYGTPPVTSHAVTGYSVIEAWAAAVERAGTLDADSVRAALEKFVNEPFLAGPTTYTADVHINHQRDLVLMEVDGGKTGNVVGIISAEKLPD